MWLLSACRRKPLVPAAILLVVLFLEAYLIYPESRALGGLESFSDFLVPDAVDMRRSVGACAIFIFAEMFLLFSGLFFLNDSHSSRSRRFGRSLLVVAIIYLAGFLSLRHGLRSLKFSLFWASDCSEYTAADSLRLAEFDADLKWAEEHLLPKSNASGEAGKMFIAINAVPNRTERYLSQTLASLLRSLSVEEVEGLRIEILSDEAFPELHAISAHSLEPLVQVVYNPSRPTAPTASTTESWRRAAVLHYLLAMERCFAGAAELCLVLDDDTLASEGWLSEVLKDVRQLESGDFGAEGQQWMMLKLFQPVWGNQRQLWTEGNVPLLISMGVFGAIPCSLLGLLARSRCQRLTPSFRFWGLVGFLASIYVVYVAGKVNLEWIIGDAAVHPHGTCHMAQANLFHRGRAQSAGLCEYLRNHSLEGPFIDRLICDFFGQGPMWATSPSLFQHAGLNTSLPGKVGPTPCRIRSFHEGLWRTRVEQRRARRAVLEFLCLRI